jgi:ABC-type multidrug transport system ATPase subunit
LLMLGLKDCADLPVGGALLKGISGGEKRRLSLAVQSESWTSYFRSRLIL